MNDNLVDVIQNVTGEQLKAEMEKVALTNKKIIDSLLGLNKNTVDDIVKNALLLYCMYKIKGGN